MAAAAPMAPPDNGQANAQRGNRRGVQPLRPNEGHSFFWRKLHSLTGIIPIGAFLVEHIISNFETWNGPLAYAQQVKFLNGLPLVRILEWAFIFIPLAFHALYGVFIWWRGRSNVNVYPWAGNWGYLTQRITGLIALAYIIQHVWRQRFSGVSLPEHPGAAFAKVQHELSNPWMFAVYAIAMIATCWHFAYGGWLFCAKWGITPGVRARRKSGYAWGALGAALCLMGFISMYAVVWKYPNAPADVMPAQPAGIMLPAQSADPYAPYGGHIIQPGTTNPAQTGEVLQAAPPPGVTLGPPVTEQDAASFQEHRKTTQPETQSLSRYSSVGDQNGDPFAGLGGRMVQGGKALPQATVPMFDPQGTVRLIPSTEVQQALQAGGAPAIRVMSSDGRVGWVRERALSAAIGHGGHVVTYEVGTR